MSQGQVSGPQAVPPKREQNIENLFPVYDVSTPSSLLYPHSLSLVKGSEITALPALKMKICAHLCQEAFKYYFEAPMYFIFLNGGCSYISQSSHIPTSLTLQDLSNMFNLHVIQPV